MLPCDADWTDKDPEKEAERLEEILKNKRKGRK